MNLLETLRRSSVPLPTGLPAIRSWRLYIEERQELDLALRRGQIGGPYTPPTSRSVGDAEVFIQWADGLCTQTTLNRHQLLRADEGLVALYSQAFLDPYPEHVPGPVVPAAIRVCSQEVKAAITEEPGALMVPMRRIEAELARLNTDQVRGQLHAQHALVTFASSEGAYSQHETTHVSYGVSIAGRATMSHEIRELPTDAVLLPRLERVRRDYEDLTRAVDISLRAPRVILTPALTRRFLDYYLRSNLSMQAILNGVSAFTREDLEQQTQYFHSSLTLTDHPLRDDHPTAFRLCQRGQSPLERPLILEGRLAGADISLRAATQGSLEPTPTSLTDNWVFEGEQTDLSAGLLERMLSSVDQAVLVYTALGLHTQDPVRGAYSLGVPRALMIRDGKIQGFVKGTMIGNFFDDLRAPLEVLTDPLSDMPMLSVQSSFTQS